MIIVSLERETIIINGSKLIVEEDANLSNNFPTLKHQESLAHKKLQKLITLVEDKWIFDYNS
jgi:hypothetical protein